MQKVSCLVLLGLCGLRAGSGAGPPDELLPPQAPPAPTWPWPWTWTSVQPFNYGNNASGFDNHAELQRKKKYKILFTDGQLDNGFNRSWRWNEEQKMSEQVRQYHVAAPFVPAFLYRPGVNIPLSFAASAGCNESSKSSWWMKSAVNGDPLPCTLNLSHPDAFQFWVQEYIGTPYAYEDPHAAGVFIDGGNPACSQNNFTSAAAQRALFNATVLAWREAAIRLNANGKVLIVSMRDHFANVSLLSHLDHTKTTCPYSEDVIFDLMANGDSAWGGKDVSNPHGVQPAVHWLAHREFHPNETPPASADACAAVIEDWAYEARGASGSLWCTYDIHPGSVGSFAFNASLAMFLLGMEAHSYFGASGGYSDWPLPEWHWWAAYDRKLGEPHNKMVRDGHTFRRHFEHASVVVDCAENTSSIEWF